MSGETGMASFGRGVQGRSPAALSLRTFSWHKRKCGSLLNAFKAFRLPGGGRSFIECFQSIHTQSVGFGFNRDTGYSLTSGAHMTYGSDWRNMDVGAATNTYPLSEKSVLHPEPVNGVQYIYNVHIKYDKIIINLVDISTYNEIILQIHNPFCLNLSRWFW